MRYDLGREQAMATCVGLVMDKFERRGEKATRRSAEIIGRRAFRSLLHAPPGHAPRYAVSVWSANDIGLIGGRSTPRSRFLISDELLLRLRSCGRVRGVKLFSIRDCSEAVAEEMRRLGLASERLRLGYVYFLRGGDMVKIGRSNDAAARICDLRRMSPIPLELVALLKGAEKEKRLHRKFAEERSHGEWFRVSGRVERFISRAKAWADWSKIVNIEEATQ